MSKANEILGKIQEAVGDPKPLKNLWVNVYPKASGDRFYVIAYVARNPSTIRLQSTGKLTAITKSKRDLSVDKVAQNIVREVKKALKNVDPGYAGAADVKGPHTNFWARAYLPGSRAVLYGYYSYTGAEKNSQAMKRSGLFTMLDAFSVKSLDELKPKIVSIMKSREWTDFKFKESNEVKLLDKVNNQIAEVTNGNG